MTQYRLLLIEDETLIRDGLASLLGKEMFVASIHQASNKKEVLSSLGNTYDLVLMDFKLRDCNGLELLPLLKNANPAVKVVAVTGLDGTELIVHLLKAGVNGVVHKLDGYGEILRTIAKVMEGGSYFPAKVLKVIENNAGRWEEVAPVTLTFSEKEILAALARGLTTKEIAAELKMTEATTETYRNRLMRKVNTPNTAALLAFAFRNGLL